MLVVRCSWQQGSSRSRNIKSPAGERTRPLFGPTRVCDQQLEGINSDKRQRESVPHSTYSSVRSFCLSQTAAGWKRVDAFTSQTCFMNFTDMQVRIPDSVRRISGAELWASTEDSWRIRRWSAVHNADDKLHCSEAISSLSFSLCWFCVYFFISSGLSSVETTLSLCLCVCPEETPAVCLTRCVDPDYQLVYWESHIRSDLGSVRLFDHTQDYFCVSVRGDGFRSDPHWDTLF